MRLLNNRPGWTKWLPASRDLLLVACGAILLGGPLWYHAYYWSLGPALHLDFVMPGGAQSYTTAEWLKELYPMHLIEPETVAVDADGQPREEGTWETEWRFAESRARNGWLFWSWATVATLLTALVALRVWRVHRRERAPA